MAVTWSLFSLVPSHLGKALVVLAPRCIVWSFLCLWLPWLDVTV